MKLEWLGTHRTFIEKSIKFANAYAYTYQKEQSFGTDQKFSSAQIQVIEYILENEDKNQSMVEISRRLGISQSAFSKNVKKMLEKGLLEKYHLSDNKKKVIVRVSQLGKETYFQYCEYVKRGIMNSLLEVIDQVPQSNLDLVAKALDMWADDLNRQPTAPKESCLIKIE